jgi:hypothetical protein
MGKVHGRPLEDIIWRKDEKGTRFGKRKKDILSRK